MREISHIEKANPVFNTAKFTLYMLSRAGIREAAMYLNALGFDESQAAGYGLRGEAAEKLLLPLRIIQESRYCFINRMIEEKGYKNIFDLACGFSPRGFRFSKAGFRYVGADLPATVALIESAAAKMTDAESKIPAAYTALDLTDPASVADAAKAFGKGVCITAEGLLMYLDLPETAKFIDSVKTVLKAHGGCFVTPDYCSGGFFRAVLFSMYGPEEGMKLMLELHKTLSAASDSGISTHSSKSTGSDAYMRSFFEERGLIVEPVPFYEDGTQLASLDQLDPETAEKIRTGLHQVMAWVVTLDENAVQDERETAAESGTAEKSTLDVDGDVLRVCLAGRVDTISTPDLIRQFEQLAGDHPISSADVDMTNLRYISSAGLRFLLILKNSVLSGRVILRNANADVMEILEMTGFAGMMEMG